MGSQERLWVELGLEGRKKGGVSAFASGTGHLGDVLDILVGEWGLGWSRKPCMACRMVILP